MPATLFAFKGWTATTLLAIVYFATFAFGATDPWALAAVAAATFVVSALWAVRAFLRPFPVRYTWFCAPLALPPAAAAVQLALGRTASPYHTAGEFAWWLVYLVFFALFVNVLDDVALRRKALRSLAYLGGAVSAAAILQALLSPNAAYGFRTAPGAPVFGPFADGESFAFLVELLFPGALFLAFRERRKLVLFLCCTLMVAAVALSGSTTGRILVGLELVVALGASAYLSTRAIRHQRWGAQTALAALGGLAVILVVIVAFGGFGAPPPPALRLDPTQASDVVSLSRAEVLDATWTLFRQSPALGSGLGAFGAVFDTVAARTDGFHWEHGYSAPAELLAEAGSFGLAAQLLLIALMLGAKRDLRTWVCILLPLIAVWAHSWVRNPLETPALVLTALALLAQLPEPPSRSGPRPGSRR